MPDAGSPEKRDCSPAGERSDAGPAPRPGKEWIIVKVPAKLWADPSLSLAAKAVLVVIRDHLGNNPTAWPGFGTLARCCGIGRNTAIRAVAELESATLIGVHRAGKGSGECNHYTLDTDRIAERYTRDGYTRDGHTQNGTRGMPKSGLKAAPLKQPQSVIENPADGYTHDGHTDRTALEAIYQAYPRHVGKAKALIAIRKAVQDITGRNGVSDPAAWLLSRVKAFAASRAGQAGKYTPHPATWFNGDRFDDDDREWNRESGGGFSTEARSVSAASRGQVAGPDRRRSADDHPSRIDAEPGKYSRRGCDFGGEPAGNAAHSHPAGSA